MEPKIDDTHRILSEDDSKVIVSKSGDCPVHEGGKYKENCLTRILEKEFDYRLYPVFRIDRETSGIVVFSKKREDVKKIFDSIKEKEYLALCKGTVEKQTIDAPIGEKKGEHIRWKKAVSPGGKSAVTKINPIKQFKNFTLVSIIPLTGRQHQIRVHLQHIGHPILGDKIYGESDELFFKYLSGKKTKGAIKRQALHLFRIKIGRKRIESELPKDMKRLMK